MKKITKIRLINWHYFTNETIPITGSFLLSGENKSGKSTIIDAIQFVLTTDHRKFNKAANEKSKRDLKSYVRCKTGVEGKSYKYKSTANIISYAAIEFLDEKTGRPFVIGAKIDSPDEDTAPSVKWYVVESSLQDIAFLTGKKPSMDKEFLLKGKKIQLISQQREAKSRIMQRLGNLNERFFSLIPLSIAFKPMDDVKQFINKFILPEHHIDVALLQNSIRSMDEFEDLMKDVADRIEKLSEIMQVKEQIETNAMDALVNEILLLLADTEVNEQKKWRLEQELQEYAHRIALAEDEACSLLMRRDAKNAELTELRVAHSTGECAMLIKECEAQVTVCESSLTAAEDHFRKLKQAVRQTEKLLTALRKYGVADVQNMQLATLMDHTVDGMSRLQLCDALQATINTLLEDYRKTEYDLQNEVTILKDKIAALEQEIKRLKNNQRSYPPDTEKLKRAIETEFADSNIHAKVHVFCDLLEISDRSWQNAIEGYLNKQRFYLIVEPKYYDIAAQVYDRMKKTISGAGLVNTAKIPAIEQIPEHSLAQKVTSLHPDARRYADYLLGRVICCDTVSELKHHSVAITSGCMVYQNHSLRKIPQRVYDVPYIGASALKRQLEIKTEQLAKEKESALTAAQKHVNVQNIVHCLTEIPVYTLKEHANASAAYHSASSAYAEATSRLDEARSDPTFIEIGMKMEAAEKELEDITNRHSDVLSQIGKLQAEHEQLKHSISETEQIINGKRNVLSNYENTDHTAVSAAKEKYAVHRREKEPAVIAQNFSPKKAEYDNKGQRHHQTLIGLQMQYEGGVLGTGYEILERYLAEKERLERSELTKYEQQLYEAKANCEMIFRESFLAQLGEQIARAKTAFTELNRALNGIFYGEDSYWFKIGKNKHKAALYDMITNENNMRHEGDTFFSAIFEAEYQEQIEDLFAKLTLSDDADKKVISEYTDYRSYLDYDIRITNKRGEVRWFSEIYADMSGGEAQTPYYVAIAASFAQLYSPDSVRIMILDEAFDKMDDERIESMMQFFNSMQFQVILGTPPGKIEVIGEYVDEVLMVYRAGDHSVIEEYML